ncbi:universal stress protein [Natronococcus wangiae]|uniref:universal stress protein n=1 Tax=Natronococcus wangiae TaxID=3068275 RepID=UPI00273EDCA6|nr:universal stress protein [Natronococcus sp. AD5]
MSKSLLTHLLVPVATGEDARTTCDALEPYLEGVERVTAVHVIEKAGGAMDKAPLEKRQEDAADFLAIVESELAERVAVDTQTVYGADVADALFDAATDAKADAIAIRARGGSRIVQLLAGNTTSKLVTDPVVPVVSLPHPNQ